MDAEGYIVPVSGGEPHTDTSTDKPPAAWDVYQRMKADGCSDRIDLGVVIAVLLARDQMASDGDVEQVGPLTVRTAPDGSQHVIASKQVTVQYPSAGGDQPDTPCPECNGNKRVWPPPSGFDYVPCPACTDKETPHA
jgi:hypothetical protein